MTLLDNHEHVTAFTMAQVYQTSSEPPVVHQVTIEYCLCGKVRARSLQYMPVPDPPVPDVVEHEQDWGDYDEWD